MRLLFLVLFFFGFFGGISHAQSDSLRGLQVENMLHPADGFTGRTLNKNEFCIHQSVIIAEFFNQTWISWGITKKLTAELDLSALTYNMGYGGIQLAPRVNARYKLRDQQGRKPDLALEAHFEYIPFQWGGTSLFMVSHEGVGASVRANQSWALPKNFHLHTSVGIGYTQNFRMGYQADNTVNYYRHILSPDISIGADWRPLPWFSAHISASYGMTPLIVSYYPKKYQGVYSFRFAPFVNRKWSLFNGFRIELIGFYNAYRGLYDASYAVPIPLLTNIYWQWTFKTREERRAE